MKVEAKQKKHQHPRNGVVYVTRSKPPKPRTYYVPKAVRTIVREEW